VGQVFASCASIWQYFQQCVCYLFTNILTYLLTYLLVRTQCYWDRISPVRAHDVLFSHLSEANDILRSSLTCDISVRLTFIIRPSDKSSVHFFHVRALCYKNLFIHVPSSSIFIIRPIRALCTLSPASYVLLRSFHTCSIILDLYHRGARS